MHNARLLTVSQHALDRGDVYPSMHWAGGWVSARGGFLQLRGVWQTSPWTRGRQPPVNRMTDVKTLPCRNFVAGGKNTLPRLWLVGLVCSPTFNPFLILLNCQVLWVKFLIQGIFGIFGMLYWWTFYCKRAIVTVRHTVCREFLFVCAWDRRKK